MSIAITDARNYTQFPPHSFIQNCKLYDQADMRESSAYNDFVYKHCNQRKMGMGESEIGANIIHAFSYIFRL